MAISAGAAALISAGASLAGTAGSTAYNAAQTKKQREWSEKMTQMQNDWNLNMWNMSNEYNSPSAQVARLRDAGLNPLYYGLDGSSANSLESAQPLGYERANMPTFDNPVAAAINARATMAQIENIQADTAKKNNENLTETQKREKLLADIENTKQELNNLKAQEGLTNSQKEEIDQRISWTDRLNEATINEKKANAALNESQKNRIDELLEGEKIMQVKEFEDFDRKWKKIDAEINKIAQETGLAKLDIENYALNHLTNGFMGTGVSLQNILRSGQFGRKPQWTDEDKEMDPMELARSGQ